MAEEKLIEHHVKYKEIHGVDETIWVSISEHKKIHNRLRREGKCNIPADVLKKISYAAQARTKKAILYRKNYSLTSKGREVQKRASTKHQKHIIRFDENIEKNVRYIENIYYRKDGTISVCCVFSGENGLKLYRCDHHDKH